MPEIPAGVVDDLHNKPGLPGQLRADERIASANANASSQAVKPAAEKTLKGKH